jgi:hypothetical protein
MDVDVQNQGEPPLSTSCCYRQDYKAHYIRQLIDTLSLVLDDVSQILKIMDGLPEDENGCVSDDVLKSVMCDYGNITTTKLRLNRVSDNARWGKRNLMCLEKEMFEDEDRQLKGDA